MALASKVYKPYSIVDGKELYIITDVAEICGRSTQTIRLWDVWSNEREDNDLPRFIPASTRVGKGNVRCWTEDEVFEIVQFAKDIKYGDIAEYSRTRWGDKAKNFKQDRSTSSRNDKKQYRKQVDSNSKKLQKQKKAQEIMEAKGNMIKAVRTRAKSIFDQIDYTK